MRPQSSEGPTSLLAEGFGVSLPGSLLGVAHDTVVTAASESPFPWRVGFLSDFSPIALTLWPPQFLEQLLPAVKTMTSYPQDSVILSQISSFIPNHCLSSLPSPLLTPQQNRAVDVVWPPHPCPCLCITHPSGRAQEGGLRKGEGPCGTQLAVLVLSVGTWRLTASSDKEFAPKQQLWVLGVPHERASFSASGPAPELAAIYPFPLCCGFPR